MAVLVAKDDKGGRTRLQGRLGQRHKKRAGLTRPDSVYVNIRDLEDNVSVEGFLIGHAYKVNRVTIAHMDRG